MSRYYIYDSVTDQVAEFGMKQNFTKMAKSVKNSGARAVAAATTKTGKGGTNAGLLREIANRTGNVYRTGNVGKAALGAAGLGAAGTVAGAAYGLNKRAKSKKEAQQKRTIKGRIKSLLGR